MEYLDGYVIIFYVASKICIKPQFMKKQGINWNDYEVVYTLKEGDLCYAFHKATDQKFIDKLNNAITKLKSNGAFDVIVKKYI